MPRVGGCPGQKTTTSGLWNRATPSTSRAFQASSSVCMWSILLSAISVLSFLFVYLHMISEKEFVIHFFHDILFLPWYNFLYTLRSQGVKGAAGVRRFPRARPHLRPPRTRAFDYQ